MMWSAPIDRTRSTFAVQWDTFRVSQSMAIEALNHVLHVGAASQRPRLQDPEPVATGTGHVRADGWRTLPNTRAGRVAWLEVDRSIDRSTRNGWTCRAGGCHSSSSRREPRIGTPNRSRV